MTETLAAVPLAPPAPAGDPADLAARVGAAGVGFLLATFVDLAGKPCATLVPVAQAEALQRDGVGFAGHAVGAIGQEPCAPHVEGAPWPFAPRDWAKPVF